MDAQKIPITGINTQVDEYSPNDGSCAQIDKFRPVGNVRNPRWEVITEPDRITFTDLPSDTLKILGVHYAFNTWHVVLYRGTGVPGENHLALFKCLYSSNVIDLNGELMDINDVYSVEIGLTTEVYFKDFGEDTFYMLISPGKDSATGQHQIWKVTEDGAQPNVFRPELHLTQVDVNNITTTKDDFDDLYPKGQVTNVLSKNSSNSKLEFRDAGISSLREKPLISLSEPPGYIFQGGAYPGILKDKDKHFGIITAFKHPNGLWVKHSSPHVLTIEGQDTDVGTNVEYATLSFTKNNNYTDNTTNYNANIGTKFLNFGHRMNDGVATNDWMRLGEIGVFMTTGKSSIESAYLEGTYFLIGLLDDDTLDWNENEETIPAGEILNIDPFSHHVITSKNISKQNNSIILIRTVTNFSLPGVEWNSHKIPGFGTPSSNVVSFKINESVSGTSGSDETLELNENCLVRVKIETEKGVFYRWNTVPFLYLDRTTAFVIYLKKFLSYPDREATQFDFYWYDSSSTEYELIYTTPLNPHPFLNIAYDYSYYELSAQDHPEVRIISYVPDTTEAISFSDILADNRVMMVEENEFKVSDISRSFFPLTWSYQVDDKIQSVISNTNDVGQGQFGEYPIYVIGENTIFGCRSGEGGVLISKFDLISSQHGLNGFDSFAVYKGLLYFVSSHGIHILSGRQIEDIHDLIEDFSVSVIGTTPSTLNPEFDISGSDSPDNIYENIIAGNALIGVNPKTREIIFSSQSSGLLIFNEKYKQWYSYSFIGVNGNESTPYEMTGISQMINVGGDLNILIPTIDTEDYFIYQWGTEGEESDKFSLITNPMVFNDYSIFKKMMRSVLKGNMVINSAGSDSGAGLYALNVVLQGKRSTNNDWETLISYVDNTVKTVRGKYLKSNKGSFQAYRVLVYGEHLAAGSFVSEIVSVIRSRGKFVK